MSKRTRVRIMKSHGKSRCKLDYSFSAQMKHTFFLAILCLIACVLSCKRKPADVNELNHPDSKVRYKTAMQLGKARNLEAVEPLIKALKDTDHSVREGAKVALIRIGSPCIESLVRYYRDDNSLEPVTVEIVTLLSGPTFRSLTSCLEHEDSEVRLGAAELLKDMGTVAIDALIEMLKNSGTSVPAAEVLAQMDSSVHRPLIELVVSREIHTGVLPLIIPVLEQSDDPQAVSALIEILTSYDMKAVGPDVRIRTIEALGNIGDAQAVFSLVRLMLSNDSTVPEIEEAIKAVEKIGCEKSAIRLLARSMLSQDSPLAEHEQAVKLLEKMGAQEEACNILIDIVCKYPKAREGSLEKERISAMRALALIGKPALTLLIERLREEYVWKGHPLTQAFVGMEEFAIPQLIEGLRTWQGYWHAAYALGEIGEPALAPLVRCLYGEDSPGSQPNTRGIVLALQHIGGPALPHLLSGLKSTKLSDAVDSQILGALREIDDPNTLDLLVKDLDCSQDWSSQALVVAAIGDTGDPRAVDTLIEVLKTYCAQMKFWHSKHKNATCAIAGAFGEIGSPAIGKLTEVINSSNPEITEEAFEALGQIGASKVLITYFTVGDPTEQRMAADTLVRMNISAILPLREALGDPRKEIRYRAALALGRIDYSTLPTRTDSGMSVAEAVIEHMIPLLNDPNTELQDAAATVLVRVSDAVSGGFSSTARQSVLRRCDEAVVTWLTGNNKLSFTAKHCSAIIQMGFKSTENILKQALHSYGTEVMAEEYMNSGNEELSEAATAWAAAHNFAWMRMSIRVPAGSGSGSWWGRNRR